MYASSCLFLSHKGIIRLCRRLPDFGLDERLSLLPRAGLHPPNIGLEFVLEHVVAFSLRKDLSPTSPKLILLEGLPSPSSALTVLEYEIDVAGVENNVDFSLACGAIEKLYPKLHAVVVGEGKAD